MEAGSLLGDTFRIEEPLGEGGMGAVYAARHVRTSKRYAVKVLHPDRAQASSDAVARFRREAAALSELGHPGIVAIHDFARTEDGIDYLVMDLLEGEDLAQRLKRTGPMSYQKALELLKPIAAALGVAHRAGIVHRDLKPGNIFVESADGVPDRPMILDFGLVKFADQRPDEPLTASGVVMGTPAYLSPEQALGKDLDHRTDVYALATLFYEMLTGSTPFEANTMTALLLKIMTAPPPPLSTRAAVPPHVDAVMARALAKDLEDRFNTATAFVEALESTDTASESVERLEIPLHDAPTLRGEAALTPSVVPIPRRGAKRRFGAILGVIALLGVVGVGAWFAGTASAPGPQLTIVSDEAIESPPTDIAPTPSEVPLDEAGLDEVLVADTTPSEEPSLEAPSEAPSEARPRRSLSMSGGGGEMRERPAPAVMVTMAAMVTPPPSTMAVPNAATAEANRLQVVRYQAQVDEIGRFLGLIPRMRREVEGLSAGRKPALCTSNVRAQLAQQSDVDVVVSRGQSLRDGIERICEPFEQLVDPPPEVRRQLRRIDDTVDRAEQMALDRTIGTNTPVAVADQVVAAIRAARTTLQGVGQGQRPFPCNAPVFTRLRGLGAAGNTWSGAAADRVVQARDNVCRRLHMDSAQLRQKEAQFRSRLDDTEGLMRQTQRTLQRVMDQYRMMQ